MKLVTDKTTLEEFTNERNWLIEDPESGGIYQMRTSSLHGGEYYVYVIQSGAMQCPTYVRHTHNGSVVIAPMESLLHKIICKQFSIVPYE